MKKKTLLGKTSHLFMCGLLGAAILITGCSDNKKAEAVEEKPAAIAVEKNTASNRNTPIVAAVKKAGPAVVGITQKGVVRDPFWGVMRETAGAGSGVIFHKDGYIATNNHVVENAKEIIVNLPDGRSLPGKLMGTDKRTDLAVVKIDAKNLPVADLGDSDSLMVGEPAIAIGNPLGMEFRGSVTVGVISALNRGVEGLYDGEVNLIQTDAAISPGNSGGALVNADGEVVGINSAKVVRNGVEGIGFAIPINTAKPILQQLMEKGTIAKPYMGLMLMDKETSEKMGMGLELKRGIFIPQVVQGGPAYKGGVRPYDIIIKFNGTEVNASRDLRKLLHQCKVGEKITLTILRGGNEGQEMELTMTVGEAPENNG